MEEATLEQAVQLGLLPEEFEAIKKVLGRTPNFNETAMYSVMWSEHCSYKNSIKYIKKLPREGSRLLVKAGEENAGLVDIGDGLAVVFKIESHNHPSAIEPFQGAATGVGGIHRDIFTMGARPIAALNSLRFGDLEEAQTQHLLKGVVSGIGHYGNCFGVPTVGGEVYFEACYQTNPLVNAMSVGVVKVGQTFSATAYGEGNSVYIVGSDTGKDGIGGASFASADITDESAEQLPAVQVGDPFQEKKLLEACMELVGKDIVLGMQDMGAAGISCSTSEMSAKEGVGMEINLGKVPTRQENMTAWEMLLSESQERMLIVTQPGKEQELETIFDKWDIHCEKIGTVTEKGNLKYYLDGKLMADLPAESLVLGGGAPVYDREYKRPDYLDELLKFDLNTVAESTQLKEDAQALIALPNIASKRWVYQQYDSMVGTANTSTNEPSDAAIVRIHGTHKGLALTTDCNGRYVYADPYKGGLMTVSEAARNLVCSGAQPVAVTNCLNFGNPYNPEVYYQFVYALRGMGEACEAFDTPVTGGNVSFYNQSPDGPVYPTPVIGMVGLIDNIDQSKMTLDFKNEGDLIYLLGESRNDLNSSEYLRKIKKVEQSPAPHFELEEELKLQKLLMRLIKEHWVLSAHDLAEGGLMVALLESAFHNGLGFEIPQEIMDAAKAKMRADAYLFGESQSRVIVTVAPKNAAAFEKELGDHPFEKIGVVTKSQIKIAGEEWGTIEDWEARYEATLPSVMEK